MRDVRVYRHRPFLAATVLGLLLVAAGIWTIVSWFVRGPSYESGVKALLFLVPLLAFAAFLVLSWRVRTVVDDTGVTQYWIRRSYRVPFAEITGIEVDYGSGRWFLRVHSGERSAEIIPCHIVRPWSRGAAGVPPRTLIDVRVDLEQAMVLDGRQ